MACAVVIGDERIQQVPTAGWDPSLLQGCMVAINGPPAGMQKVLIRPVALLCANIIAVGILMVLHPKNLTCGVCVTRKFRGILQYV